MLLSIVTTSNNLFKTQLNRMKLIYQVLCLLLISALPIAVLSTNTFDRKKDFKSSPSDPVTIPLEKDIYGNYYIETNLDFSSKNFTQGSFQGSSVTNIGKMLVNLYSNETFIASCSKFLPYTSEEFDYSHEKNPARKIEFLYEKMRVIGYDVNLDIQTPAFTFVNFPGVHAVICDSGFKGDDHGYIGLGSGNNLMANTLTHFSIVSNTDKEISTDLALYLGSQSTIQQKYGKSSFSMTVKTKENWAMTMVDLQVTLPNEEFTTTLNTVSSYDVIFDLNSEIIGVPVNLYKFIITILKGYNIVCDEDKHSTSCKSENADTSALPTFGLVLSKNTTSQNVIPLTPELYFDKVNSKLIIKSMSDDEFGLLKINPSFSRAVVLGAPFMRLYNVHFSNEHQQSLVTIEKSRPLSKITSSYILIAIAIALVSYTVVVGLGYLCYYREFKKGIFAPNNSEEQEGPDSLLEEEEQGQRIKDEFTVSIISSKKNEKRIEEAATATSSLIGN